MESTDKELVVIWLISWIQEKEYEANDRLLKSIVKGMFYAYSQPY